MEELALIGYSGHSYVVNDIFLSNGIKPSGYFEINEKTENPYRLKYLGKENSIEALEYLSNTAYFIAIGDNELRQLISNKIQSLIAVLPINAIHNKASVSSTAIIGFGVMIGDGCIVNSCAKISEGVICNTQSVIEHECYVGPFSHVAPGAVLCGNVYVGSQSFVGARAVVKQGIKIGDNVTIGAGTVVISDIPDNSVVVGNPQRFI